MFPENRILDVFQLNDEIDLMRYRLAVHAPITLRTVIIENRRAFTGAEKPLHARAALTSAEIARYNIRLVELGDSPKRLQRVMRSAAASTSNITFEKEDAAFHFEQNQRKMTGLVVKEELEALLRSTTFGGDFLVHISDVDEILDPALLLNARRPVVDTCVSPSLRNYAYGVHCAEYKPAFARGVAFRAKSDWLNYTMSHRPFNYDPLRNMERGRSNSGHCPHTRSFVGWHLSYFMSSAAIFRKVSMFSHQNDPHVAKIRSAKEPAELITRLASECVTAHQGKKLAIELLPYSGTSLNGKHPKGLPRSSTLPPELPSSSTTSQLAALIQHPAAPSRTLFSEERIIGGELRRCEEMLRETADALARATSSAFASSTSGTSSSTAFEYNRGEFAWSSAWVSQWSGGSWLLNAPLKPAAPLGPSQALWVAASRHDDVNTSCATLRRLRSELSPHSRAGSVG